MASKISGVGVHTIRAWEKRYKALEPVRDSSGHRTYTKADIEKLMLLSELCLLGYTISKVAKFEIPDLKLLLKDLGKSDESIDSPEFNLIKEKLSVDASGSTNILLFALKNYKLDVINQEIGKLKTMVSSRDMAMNIVMPLSNELRELRNRGEFSQIQEETVINLLRFHSGHALYHQNDRRDRNSVNVVVAGIAGATNDLGLIMAGLLCNHYGFNFSFLGPDISVEALSDSLGFLNTNLIILSALNTKKTFVEKLMSKATPALQVLLAGKMDLELESIPTKRFKNCKSIEELDEYLSKKYN
ncbi:MAG: MerR family transcriptional regulator [Bacteriovorax sp.]|nr:MerR family transcriptional regulator [Bacteriovorax sp.]